jgi:hypothetical protein
VVAGDGPELDATDLVSNPAALAGAVSVEVDEAAGTIAVSVVEAGCVTRLGVALTYDGPTTTVAVVSDALFESATEMRLDAVAGVGSYELEWTASGGTCVGLGPVGSTTVVDYALLILVYDDFGPGGPMPVAGGGAALAAVAAVVLLSGLLLRRAGTRRPARPR